MPISSSSAYFSDYICPRRAYITRKFTSEKNARVLCIYDVVGVKKKKTDLMTQSCRGAKVRNGTHTERYTYI